MLDLFGRLVAMGTCLDFPEHSLRYDQAIRKGSQKIEAIDTGEENQWRGIND